MMIGEARHHYHNLTHAPTVHNPPWVAHNDSTATIISSSSSPMAPSPLSVATTASGNTSPSSPTTNSYLLSNYDTLLTALSRYLPSNEPDGQVPDLMESDGGFPIDSAYANSDDFRMYEFKVRRCTRAKAHDWTECPFAHPGEKARRRDPRRYSYSGTACTDFRKGSCRRGDACEFAHGVFECWLHPTRYRTQACKDGPNCQRRVCFFAHSPDQLRVVSGQPSPRSMGSGADPFDDAVTGLESSPPVTPIGRTYGSSTLNDLVVSLRNLQLNKVKSMPTGSGWKVQMGVGSPRFVSTGGSVVRPGSYSLPTTPTRPAGVGYLDAWEEEREEEELIMERVESGRELRARMFQKLSKENPLSLPDQIESGTSAGSGSGPDVGWVTDLVK